ncbi:PDZ domain-containing protein [Sulfurimonas lithotrophica]|uniref:PDZ domain-containing protein n=1 Tax=Sulfurimonas lithotrophica TaxID=2590022 RepID=A0A5P8NYI6_9BACT|nr:PDZ domain-containing protein [Sulfurimonas lithotrophica]QFR48470.1 PDZ domain-containing protein [Sulfurimonas lithotrophica]
MLRVFFALNFLILNLLACKGGYQTCIQKVQDSNSIQRQTIQIPISKKQKLIYSNIAPDAKIIKHDPFLNLYLIEANKSFKYPFRTNYKLSLGHAAVDNTMAIEGKFKRKQIGLNRLANFTEVVNTPALLLNSCCALEGLVTPKGIIQKEYIDNFLKNKKVAYGDIGIRADDKNDKVIISRINPFDNSIKLKKGDIVLAIDSKEVKDASFLMCEILFSDIGKKHKLKIKRDKKILTIEAITKKRFGGGAISDTFLETKGLYFANDLTILKISKNFKSYGIKVGDKLLQVNGKKVSSTFDIRKNIDDFKSHASLLFVRDDFQFFVNIN